MTDTAVLHVNACPECGWRQVPPGRCQRCRTGVVPSEARALGEVLASTVIERVPPEVLVAAPYMALSVHLDDGLEVVAIASVDERLVPGARVSLSAVQVARDGAQTWAFEAALLEASQGSGQ